MTARDDYPLATNDWSIDVINRALDEIDRHRKEIEIMRAKYNEQALRLTSLRECLGACLKESLL